ncbi:MAG: hypothetical protein KBD02_04850 [Bacteroides sp.]|nr:hypothetical protein [Bacteroides sp.]
MKVDKITPDNPDKLQVVQQAPVKTETLMDSIRPFKGHTLFEINCSTGNIIAAEYEEINATLHGGVKKKVIIKENCLYISCLNKKSALKKYTAWITDRLMSNIKIAINEEKAKP